MTKLVKGIRSLSLSSPSSARIIDRQPFYSFMLLGQQLHWATLLWSNSPKSAFRKRFDAQCARHPSLRIHLWFATRVSFGNSNNSAPLSRVDLGRHGVKAVLQPRLLGCLVHRVTSVEAMLTEITVMFGNKRLEGSSLWTCSSPRKGFPTPLMHRWFRVEVLFCPKCTVEWRRSLRQDWLHNNFRLWCFKIRESYRMIWKVNWKHEMKVGNLHLIPIIRPPEAGRTSAAEVSCYILLCRVQALGKLWLMETSEQPHANTR